MSARVEKPWGTGVSVRAIDAAGVAACALLLAAAYLVGLAPRLRERSLDAERRAELDRGRVELSGLITQKRDLEAKSAELKVKRERNTVRLQGVREVNRRADVILDVAGASGLRVAEIAPGAPVTKDGLTVVPIRLRGTGTYGAVTQLLSRLHEKYRDTAVTTLTLSAGVDEQAAPEFSVDFAWFALPDGAARAAAAPPAK